MKWIALSPGSMHPCIYALVAKLLYGCGLRLFECFCELRVQDLEFCDAGIDRA